MSLTPVKDKVKYLGVIKKSSKFDGFYLKVKAGCELVLYDAEAKEYYKVNKTAVQVLDDPENPDDLFLLSVNLNSTQVELIGKDE